MQQPSLKISTALICSLGLTFGAFAQTEKINVVTTAVPFLRISPDARAGGMGDVGIATAPDANSAYWNLAKTPFNKSNSGIAVTYTPWLKDLGLNDVYLASLTGYYKLDDGSAVSGSLRYFNLGSIDFTDFSGNLLQTQNPREFSIDFGYSRKLSDKLSLGLAFRYINSNLAGGANVGGITYKAGNAFAGDLSMYYNGLKENGSGFTFGAAITNLGSKIGYTNDATQQDFIPANLGIGAAYTTVIDENNKITFAADINKLLVPTPPVIDDNASQGLIDTLVREYRTQGVTSSWFKSFGDAPGGFSEELQEYQIGLGAEYTYADQFSVRAGYFHEGKQKGNRRFFSVGLGVKYNVFGLNFSYLVPTGSGITRNPLSNTLRFSLVFDLDKETNGSNGNAPE
jgi:hypothetical protein